MQCIWLRKYLVIARKLQKAVSRKVMRFRIILKVVVRDPINRIGRMKRINRTGTAT